MHPPRIRKDNPACEKKVRPLRLRILLTIEDWSTVPAPIVSLLKSMGEIGERAGINVFVVGGLVRDLLLGARNLDLDVVVEGDAIAFAHRLAKEWGGSVHFYEK